MAATAHELRASNPIRLAGLLAAGLALCLTAARAEIPAPSYADLVAQAESGDPATDFTALRQAYAVSEGYDGYGAGVEEPFHDMWMAFKAKDCAKAIAKSDEILKDDYTQSTVHFIRRDCFKQMGDQARADREESIARGLIHSLLSSGDGKSAATAYVVVTMEEERLVLSYLELNEERQALVNEGGHNYDLIEGKNEKTGEAGSAYFNVDALLAGTARMLQKAN